LLAKVRVIEPFAWAINQSFAGGEVQDPVLPQAGRT
jgi:hypothetical protein